MFLTLKLDRHELSLYFPYDLTKISITVVDSQLTITSVENGDILYQMTTKGTHGVANIIGISNE